MTEETILGNADAGTLLSDGGNKTENENEEEIKEESKKELESEKDKDDVGEAVKDKDSLADKSEGAPETYSDYTLPEGMTHDADAVAEANVIFKELGLTQDQAQKLINLEVQAREKETIASQNAWTETVEGWKKASTNDKEFGGGALDENLTVAKEAVHAYGNDAFKEMLEITGITNHPEMIRFLVKAGKAVAEDKIIQGSGGVQGEKTQAQKLYPEMK